MALKTRSVGRSVKLVEEALTATQDISYEAEFELAVAVVNPSTNLQIDIGSIAAAKMQLVWLESDVAMTVKVNSSGSPPQTFTLSPEAPVLWTVSDGVANPFTVTTLTTLFATNSSGTDGNLQIVIGYDPT